MTTTAETLPHIPPEIGKALISGEPIRLFAIRARFVKVKEQHGIEVGTLLVRHSTDLQKKISRQLCDVLHTHLIAIPTDSLAVLQVISTFLPETAFCEIDVFIRMQEDGSRLWTVVGSCFPAATLIPGVPEEIEKAGRECLEVVTEALQ